MLSPDIDTAMLIEPREETIDGIHELWLQGMHRFKPFNSDLQALLSVEGVARARTRTYVAEQIDHVLATDNEDLVVAHIGSGAVVGVARSIHVPVGAGLTESDTRFIVRSNEPTLRAVGLMKGIVERRSGEVGGLRPRMRKLSGDLFRPWAFYENIDHWMSNDEIKKLK